MKVTRKKHNLATVCQYISIGDVYVFFFSLLSASSSMIYLKLKT